MSRNPRQDEAKKASRIIVLASTHICEEKWVCLTCVLIFKLSRHLGIFSER